jgi:hypothetical protein
MTAPAIAETTEAQRIVERATAAGVLLRATGGVAVALRSPSAGRPPLRRTYGDIDFVARSEQAHEVGTLFAELGYAPEEEFNLLHGQRRLFFREPEGRWEADVFLDRIEGCHTLDLRDRLDVAGATLAPADLLLSKLQVVQTNAKDYQDILGLLADHELGDDDSAVSRTRITDVCANDWGWWRTVTMVARAAQDVAGLYAGEADETTRTRLEEARDRLGAVLDDLETAPKSRRWKLRARVGDRKRWYELPEDIEH